MADLLSKVASLLGSKSWTPPKAPESTQPKSGSSQPESKPMRRLINKDGLDLIKHYESLELEAYPDPGSALGKACSHLGLPMRSYRKVENWQSLAGGPWTIGWGHTGPEVHQGMQITQDQAEAYIHSDVEQFERGVERLVKVPVNDNQFSALVCFAYNCGLDENHNGKAEGLGESTLLRLLNAGDYAGAAKHFEDWEKSGGVVLAGLVARRQAERDLFLKG